jgi:hypothetical protein
MNKILGRYDLSKCKGKIGDNLLFNDDITFPNPINGSNVVVLSFYYGINCILLFLIFFKIILALIFYINTIKNYIICYY